MKSRVIAAVLVLALMAGGCASKGATGRSVGGFQPSSALVARVPHFIAGEQGGAPAALAMSLSWAGFPTEPAELFQAVSPASPFGSPRLSLIAAARQRGALAGEISGLDALLRELAAGHPVVVLLNRGFSWWPDWNYAVAVGYDLPADRILLQSGKLAQKEMTMAVFDDAWVGGDRWGLLILPPDKLAAGATERMAAEAVVGLERTRNWKAAAMGYRAMLTRWPESVGAWIGLGNCLYAQRDLAGAEKTLEEATRRMPREGALFNNLARLRLERGKRGAAQRAAERAVALGGPLTETYRRTLAEIVEAKGQVPE